MVIIQEENFEQAVVEDYVAHKKAEHPLMLVFCADENQNSQLDDFKRWMWNNFKYSSIDGHPLKQGHEHFLHDGILEKISDHPEMLNEVFLPSTYTEETQLVIYHRYSEQFKASHLNYLVDFVNKYKIPTVCLMNKYEMGNCLSWYRGHFNVVSVY